MPSDTYSLLTASGGIAWVRYCVAISKGSGRLRAPFLGLFLLNGLIDVRPSAFNPSCVCSRRWINHVFLLIHDFMNVAEVSQIVVSLPVSMYGNHLSADAAFMGDGIMCSCYFHKYLESFSIPPTIKLTSTDLPQFAESASPLGSRRCVLY